MEGRPHVPTSKGPDVITPLVCICTLKGDTEWHWVFSSLHRQKYKERKKQTKNKTKKKKKQKQKKPLMTQYYCQDDWKSHDYTPSVPKEVISLPLNDAWQKFAHTVEFLPNRW